MQYWASVSFTSKNLHKQCGRIVFQANDPNPNSREGINQGPSEIKYILAGCRGRMNDQTPILPSTARASWIVSSLLYDTLRPSKTKRTLGLGQNRNRERTTQNVQIYFKTILLKHNNVKDMIIYPEVCLQELLSSCLSSVTHLAKIKDILA